MKKLARAIELKDIILKEQKEIQVLDDIIKFIIDGNNYNIKFKIPTIEYTKFKEKDDNFHDIIYYNIPDGETLDLTEQLAEMQEKLNELRKQISPNTNIDENYDFDLGSNEIITMLGALLRYKKGNLNVLLKEFNQLELDLTI